MDKNQLRKIYSEKRKALSPEEIEEKSITIANNVLQLPIWDKTYYHVFLTIEEKKEVNTQYLLHILNGRDKSIVVPKANFYTSEMSHFLLQENTVLKLSHYNIPEPLSGIEILPQQIDVVFVPLLAFDTMGNRLGYGKGFYDRFLSQCQKNALFIGLSFFEAEEKIVTSENDIPLRYCITPDKNYIF